MFSKIISLILVALFVISLFGCSRGARYTKRFPGWEQVRIEKEVPQKNCEYKIQKACSKAGSVVGSAKKSGCKFYSKTAR